MTNYSFGDIILIPFPFTDQSTAKKRPAVVISNQAYHQNRPDLIVMAVTSQVKSAQTTGEVTVQDWQGAGLLKPSMIKPVITTIEPSLILKKLGQLKTRDQEALKKAILSIVG